MIPVLAVDDEIFNLDLIELALMDKDIKVEKALDGEEAIKKLEEIEPYVILLDLRMPKKDGFEVLKYLKNSKYKDIPVIVITANEEEKHKALEMGANDFLSKPIDPKELLLRTLNFIEMYKQKKYLDKLVEERTKELKKALKLLKETELEISERLGIAGEFRDVETGMHIKRVSRYSALLARLIKFKKEEIELILYASPLHDIGKIGIPDAILLKPGKLTEEEFEIMKKHTVIGAKMLEGAEKYPVLNVGKIIALTHHEKWDGSGYPNGLKGEDIPIYGRIVAVADVFDALTSKRVYKDALSPQKALEIMKEGRGKHFDPELFDVFEKNFDKFLEIRKRYQDKDKTPHILNLLEIVR